jgi:glutamate dehydrogenase (NAD(P)+)
MFIILQLLKKMDMDITNTTIAIQGMGNVGSSAARSLYEAGAKIIAVSDVSGGLYNENGLDINDISAFLDQGRNLLSDYPQKPDDKRITNQELLATECDILIPAALQNQITSKNVDTVKAKIIVEGANGPISDRADAILYQRGVTVVPDILANSGGVIVSYCEWVQNIQAHMWSEKEVYATLERILRKAFNQAYKSSKEYECSMRYGAYIVALKKLTGTLKKRGLYP